MTFDVNDLAVFLILFLAALGLAEVVGMLRRWIKPEPPPKKTTWTVSFTDPRGYPMLGYAVDEKAFHRLLKLTQHEYLEKG